MAKSMDPALNHSAMLYKKSEATTRRRQTISPPFITHSLRSCGRARRRLPGKRWACAAAAWVESESGIWHFSEIGCEARTRTALRSNPGLKAPKRITTETQRCQRIPGSGFAFDHPEIPDSRLPLS